MNISLQTIVKWLALLWLLGGAVSLWGQAENAPYRYVEVLQDGGDQTIYTDLPEGGTTVIQNTTNGTATVFSNDKIQYTPDFGFAGLDYFVVEIKNFSPFYTKYIALEIHVKPSLVNAYDDRTVVASNGSITNFPVLSNDSSSFSGLKIRQVAVQNYGTASITADSLGIDFTPDPGFTGIASLLYTVCDSIGTCDQAVFRIRVKEASIPNTIYLSVGEYETLPVLLPDTGFSVNTNPAHGSLAWIGNLELQYQPEDNFGGVDTFQVQDGSGQIVDYIIDVLNKPVPDIYINPDVAHMPLQMASVDIDVLDNDFRKNQINPSKLSIFKKPAHGSASIDPNTGLVTYIPNPGFEGVDVFTYRYHNPALPVNEQTPVYVVVADQVPLQGKFELNTRENVPRVIAYDAPFAEYDLILNKVLTKYDGFLEYYPGDTTITVNGQQVSGYNLLVYYPQEDFTTNPGDPDEFEFEYCALNNCYAVKVEVVIEASASTSSCVGTDCLWAGDANNDGIVDGRDYIAIGLGMGHKGTPRSNTTTNWEAQAVSAWPYNGLDLSLEYADTDGDGLISDLDLQAVHNHYLKTNNVISQPIGIVKPKLNYTILTPPPFQPGDFIEMEIAYGTSSNPVLDGYGFSLNFLYDPTVIVDSTLVVDFYEDNWLGYASPLIGMGEQVGSGRLDLALTRTNGLEASGHGAVLKVGFIIDEDIAGIRPGEDFSLQMQIMGGYAMNGAGQAGGLNDLLINLPISLQEETEAVTAQDPEIAVFPNPTADRVQLFANGRDQINSVTVFNAMGQPMQQFEDIEGSQFELNLQNAIPGIYLIKVATERGVSTKKVQVVRTR